MNCAAVPDTLLESELFGHEKGAFTGADRRRIGRFEQAAAAPSSSTKSARCNPRLQAKFLRALQEREIERLGSSSPSRSTSASSPPPTATSKRRSPRASCAKTSTTA